MTFLDPKEFDLPDGPVADIHDLLWACAPDVPVPPGHDYYVDLQPLRNDNIQKSLQRTFGANRRGWLHRCLCGHRGSGKSTELLRFMHWAAGEGFLPVRMEVFEHLGTIPLEFSDLCLLTAMQVEAALKEVGQHLPAEKTRGVVEWFSEIIKEHKDHVTSELALETQAQLGNQIPLIGKLVAKFTAGMKAGSSHAKTIREHLRNFPDALRDRTNDLLDEANHSLAENGRGKGLLLVFDQLDRYDPDAIDRVMVRGGELVRSLHCHSIYTVPIALHYSPISGKLEDNYSEILEVPMAALRPPAAPWRESVASSTFDEAAVKHFSEILLRRIDPALFEDPADALRLARMSGGCARELLHLVGIAFTYSEDRLTTDAVTRAITRYRLQLSERLDRQDYELLAKIARREDHGERSKEYQRLLNLRYVLAYHGAEVAWRDVHPAIVEIQEFQDALREGSPLQH